MEQQFKVGDIVQVATMENLPNESRNWALGEGLKLGIDYTVESAEGGWVIIKEGTNKFSHRESRFKLKSSNMELKITKDKVLQAAAKCSTAKATLETLFPEAFEENEQTKTAAKIKIFSELLNESNLFPFDWYMAMPGDGIHEKTKLLFENYIKPHLPKC